MGRESTSTLVSLPDIAHSLHGVSIKWNVQLRIAYLVPNLGDAAARRRFSMFTIGGAKVSVAGFIRQGQASPTYDGVDPVCLGVSFDARMIQRAKLVAMASLKLEQIQSLLETSDVIVARNLEMLALAVLARRRFRLAIPIVYECLDIHRLMLSRSVTGRVLRAIEGWLLRQTSALIVSSPAFVRNYFQVHHTTAMHHLLVENRLLDIDDAGDRERQPQRSSGPPWRIGWFGIIRCRKSLDFLLNLARKRPDLIEVEIRGRPFLEAIPDIEKSLAGSTNVVFRGPYAPADLPALYADVHFTWAIDFYEEGQNSEWLLPNRLYEGCSFGSVPIAMKQVETGHWLAERGLGVLLDTLDDLAPALSSMTPTRYEALKEDVGATPRSAFVASRQDCVDIVAQLATLVHRHPAGPTPVA
ncbi:MAG: succinoglycan biosynthesis protein [Hyphomicrobiales bacterium]|nr:succinoglycan biosynthesis protein [Hyphomicrobiales bacterium]